MERTWSRLQPGWGAQPGKNPQPSPLQVQYILASRQAASRRQRMTFSAVLLGLILAIGLGIFAWISRGEAVSQSNQRATAQVNAENAGATAVAESRVRATAEANAVSEANQRATAQAVAVEQRDTALSRQMAAQSSARLADGFDLSLLLAVESSGIKDTAEGRSSLAADLQAYPGLIRYLHASTTQQSFLDLAVSPDGKTIAAGGDGNEIVLWDARSGLQIGEPLKGHDTWIHAVRFTPDSRTLVSSDVNGRIVFWDLGKHQHAHQLETAAMRIEIALSPDGKTLITGDGSGQITTWDIATGQKRASWKGCQTEGMINSLAVNPRGNWIASACYSGEKNDDGIGLWALPDGHPIGKTIPIPVHPGSVAFSPDGHLLARSAGRGGWPTAMRG